MWTVQATVTTKHATVATKQGTWETTIQVPTFYLNPQTQGILNEEQAIEIAKSIINPTKDPNIIIRVSIGTP